jgi:hypothetical protein
MASRGVRRSGRLVGAAAILWFGGKLWASYRGIHDTGGGSLAVAAAANVLPAIMQAALVAGVGAGVLGLGLWGHRDRSTGSAGRWLATLAAGSVVGLAGIAAVLVGYRNMPSIAGVATALMIAVLVGAALMAVRADPTMAAAGLTGALASVVAATILGSDRVVARMMSAFGGRSGASPAEIIHANSLVSHIDAALVGVVAGVAAYLYLRRGSGRSGIPGYVSAGAMTGVLLLMAEPLIRIGGMGVLRATRSISMADAISLDEFDASRVIGAMIVLFVGAFVALIGYGRSLPARVPVDEEEGAEPDVERPAPPAQRSS